MVQASPFQGTHSRALGLQLRPICLQRIFHCVFPSKEHLGQNSPISAKGKKDPLTSH